MLLQLVREIRHLIAEDVLNYLWYEPSFMLAVFNHNLSTGNSLSSDDQQLVQAHLIIRQCWSRQRTHVRQYIFCKDDYDNFALLLVSAEMLMIKPCNAMVMFDCSFHCLLLSSKEVWQLVSLREPAS